MMIFFKQNRNKGLGECHVSTLRCPHEYSTPLELELELIQTQMAQKPMLRAEVYAHAMRASQNRKKEVRREKEV